MPPSPAISPAVPKTKSCTVRTLNPSRPAMALEPPTANTARPIKVRVNSRCVRIAATTSTRNSSGNVTRTPSAVLNCSKDAVPLESIAAGISMMCFVPTKVFRKPVNKYCVPIVTIRLGTANRQTMKPFSSPISAPKVIENTSISANGAAGKNSSVNVVVVYSANTPIAVNDTSIPPAASTSSTPSAKIPKRVVVRIVATRFCGLKKRGSSRLTPSTSSTINPSVMNSGLALTRPHSAFTARHSSLRRVRSGSAGLSRGERW